MAQHRIIRYSFTLFLSHSLYPLRQARSQKCEIGGKVMKVEGQHVERRRRENRCAVGAEDQGAVGAEG